MLLSTPLIDRLLAVQRMLPVQHSWQQVVPHQSYLLPSLVFSLHSAMLVLVSFILVLCSTSNFKGDHWSMVNHTRLYCLNIWCFDVLHFYVLCFRYNCGFYCIQHSLCDRDVRPVFQDGSSFDLVASFQGLLILLRFTYLSHHILC